MKPIFVIVVSNARINITIVSKASKAAAPILYKQFCLNVTGIQFHAQNMIDAFKNKICRSILNWITWASFEWSRIIVRHFVLMWYIQNILIEPLLKSLAPLYISARDEISDKNLYKQLGSKTRSNMLKPCAIFHEFYEVS